MSHLSGITNQEWLSLKKKKKVKAWRYNQDRQDNGSFSLCCDPVKVWIMPGIERGKAPSKEVTTWACWDRFQSRMPLLQRTSVVSSWRTCFTASQFWQTCLRSLCHLFFSSPEYPFFSPLNTNIFVNLMERRESAKSIFAIYIYFSNWSNPLPRF